MSRDRAQVLPVSIGVVLALMAGPALAGGGFLRGDVDQSGQRTLADAYLLCAYVFGFACNTPPCLDSCDVDDSGTVEFADALHLIGSAYEVSGYPIPAPESSCGLDPTPDSLDCASFSCGGGGPSTPTPELHLRIVDQSMPVNGSVDVSVRVDATVPFSSLAFGVCFDPSLVSVNAIAIGPSYQLANVGLVVPELTGVRVGFLSDLLGSVAFPAGADQELFSISFESTGTEGSVPLVFCDDPGSFEVGIEFTDTACPPQRMIPTTTDGLLLIGNTCDSCVAIRGDVNADGAVDLGDPILLLGYLFGGETLTAPCTSVADVEGSGVVDLGDAIFALNYLFASGPPPVSPGFPGPACLD